MLTHTIKISKDTHYPVVYTGQHSNYYPNNTKVLVGNQQELDDYLKEHSWVRPGLFLCFTHANEVRDVYSVHFIADVVTDYDKLSRPGAYNRDAPPKIIRVVCCNITEGGVSSWDRLDNIVGYRVMRDDEVARMVDDNLRHRIQLWKDQNGYKENQSSQTDGT